MRVRYGKPIKVKSLFGLQNNSTANISNENRYFRMIIATNTFEGGSGIYNNSLYKGASISNEDYLFLVVKTNIEASNFGACYFTQNTAVNYTNLTEYKTENLIVIKQKLSTSSSDTDTYHFRLSQPTQVTYKINYAFLLNASEIGLDNLTAQEFYNKYNKYFSLIATGEEITIDDKAGQIAYKNLEEDSIRCKVAGGSSDIYYGYNSCFQYWYMFNDRFRTGWSESGFATRVDDRDNQIITLTVADTTQTPQWFAYMWPDSFQPSGTFANHKVLFMIDILSNKELTGVIYIYSKLLSTNIPDEWTTCWVILENNAMNYNYLTNGTRTNFEIGDTLSFKNVQCIDLTKWFGAGKEPTTLSEFREKFTKEIWGYCPTPIKLTRYQIEALPSYGYNQLFKVNNWSRNGINFTYDTITGKLHVYGTATSNVVNQGLSGDPKITTIVGHKYYSSLGYSSNTFGSEISNNEFKIPYNQLFRGNGETTERIWTETEVRTNILTFSCVIWSGNEVDFIFYPKLIDLTDWYGEGNEPTTIEEFKATFPNKYYPYSKKRLLNKYMINKLID